MAIEAQIFLYTLLFVASAAVGITAENFGLACITFVFGVVLISIKKSATNTKKLELAGEIIDAHAQELSIRRRQLTVQKGYGLTDDSKWQKEIEFFIDHVIAPRTGAIDMFSKPYREIRKSIAAATADYESITPSFNEKMPPTEYEQLVAKILCDLGWNARLTAATGDQGIDVIAEQRGVKVVIQCKLYSKPVGNAAVQEAIAGKSFEQANFAAVVSNASFTRAAKQLASSSNVFLLHHEQLGELQSMCAAL